MYGNAAVKPAYPATFIDTNKNSPGASWRKRIDPAGASRKRTRGLTKTRQMAAETTTASGIIIPDSAQEKPQKGKIIAVGPGTKDNPVTLKVGDNILYGKYSGTELKHENTNYLIMRESDI